MNRVKYRLRKIRSPPGTIAWPVSRWAASPAGCHLFTDDAAGTRHWVPAPPGSPCWKGCVPKLCRAGWEHGWMALDRPVTGWLLASLFQYLFNIYLLERIKGCSVSENGVCTYWTECLMAWAGCDIRLGLSSCLWYQSSVV